MHAFTTVGTFKGKPVTVDWIDGSFYGPEPVLSRLAEMRGSVTYGPAPTVLVLPDPSHPDVAAVMVHLALDSVSSTDGPEVDFSDEIPSPPSRVRVAKLLVSKHGGSSHDQKDHGNWAQGSTTDQSMHGAPALNPYQGKGTVSGQGVLVYLQLPDGSAPHVSSEHLTEFVQIGGFRPTISSSGIHEKIDATMDDFGFTDQLFDENLTRVLDSAFDRYRGPEGAHYWEHDQFYLRWHNDLLTTARGNGQEFSDVVAAAAVISPGLDADLNLSYAHELSNLVKENPALPAQDQYRRSLPTKLEADARLIRFPLYTEDHQDVIDGLAKVDDPRPPETSKVRLAIAEQLESDAARIRSGEATHLLDLNGESAARVASLIRTERQGAGYVAGKGWTNYASAINVLRGFDVIDGQSTGEHSVTADLVLNGIKTRSFYNNIVDPTNEWGRNDVTVDFHTINFAGFVLGADKSTKVQGTPRMGGVGFGVRTRVADAIHRASASSEERYGQHLTPSRVQEILWAEWRRGQSGSVWSSFSGESFELGLIDKNGRVR
jgi:hypothetical protein